jgi:hypothetical protein
MFLGTVRHALLGHCIIRHLKNANAKSIKNSIKSRKNVNVVKDSIETLKEPALNALSANILMD